MCAGLLRNTMPTWPRSPTTASIRRASVARSPYVDHRAVAFDRGRVGCEVEYVGDPSAQRVIGHHRIRGWDFTGPPRSASSAVPTGFPSRV